jgi:hypothetical protein
MPAREARSGKRLYLAKRRKKDNIIAMNRGSEPMFTATEKVPVESKVAAAANVTNIHSPSRTRAARAPISRMIPAKAIAFNTAPEIIGSTLNVA